MQFFSSSQAYIDLCTNVRNMRARKNNKRNERSRYVRCVRDLQFSSNLYGRRRRKIDIINNCFESWHERWITTYLEDKREFKIVYDLMEGLMHYEYQIRNNEIILSSDRTNAIARAVARLVDYGNSLLGLDLIIRADDETSSEIDSSSVTTIELFHAHIKAHNLREKLLYDYFKKDKPSPNTTDNDTTSISSGNISLVITQVPSSSQQSSQSPLLERSHRSSIGSSTSINSLSDGRRTPQPISSLLNHIELQTSTNNLDSFSVEIAHMMAAIRSNAFSTNQNSATRLSLIPGLLNKIETLISVPTNFEKITTCFSLLDALFQSIEKLPIESRQQEVAMMTSSLLKPLVRKVHIDDRDNLVEFQHAHWTTCFISMIRLMTASDFNSYLRNFTNLADLGAFLKDYLFVIKRLMSDSDCKSATSPLDLDVGCPKQSELYPACWIEMTLLACSIFLKSLASLYQVMRQYFTSNLRMWSIYIDCLIHFILRDTLNPNRSILKEQQRLLAAEVRQISADYVLLSWNSLNYDQKSQLLEDLIDPLLRASMILKSRQRSILLPIFYDMMRCDYSNQYITSGGSESSSSTLCSRDQQSYSNFMYDANLESITPISIMTSNTINASQAPNESLPYLSCNEVLLGEDGTVLTKFTHLIIGKLNNLTLDLGLGDELFKIEFCATISGELNLRHQNLNSLSNSQDTSQFKSMAKQTSNLIAEFLQICLDARLANKLSYKHLYLLCLFKLILFFRDKVDRIELYLGNLYKLCYLHHTAKRYVEAGYTLLEYAKSLPWSDKPLGSHCRVVTRFFQTTEPLNDYSSLKIFLYNSIMEYFDQGQVWEAAVPLCRELIDIYQYKTFEYDKLAQLLQKMSIYFSNITKPGQRSDPEYFRVTFYGCGFPVTLRGTTMVYRGKPYEKLADFQNTMLCKYPDATLLNSLAKPDESLLSEPEQRFLQINACSPVIDLKEKFGSELSKVDEYILNYYRHNECDKFNFSRKISKPNYLKTKGDELTIISDDNFANIWRERTILTTNTLPNMLSFFPVYLIETKIVSPIESAIEDLERTNDRLSCMVNRFRADKRQAEDVRLLGQLLLGVVDAAVNGGITKYEDAFFSTSIKPAKVATTSTTTTATTTTTSAVGLESNLEGLHLSNEMSLQQPKQPPIHGKQETQTNEKHSSCDVDRPTTAQVDKLKYLIAGQVPLLDEAIRLHRDRVADVMRPQHDHLEGSYKELKRHIMSKYSRYLPAGYSRLAGAAALSASQRSYRSLARSPNRSARSESRNSLLMMSSNTAQIGSSLANRFPLKRMSDVGAIKSGETSSGNNTNTNANNNNTNSNNDHCLTSSSIPYRQLSSERRSLPFLTGGGGGSGGGGGDLPTATSERDMNNGNVRQLPPLPPMSGFSNREDVSTGLGLSGSYLSGLPTMRDQQFNRPIPAARASVNNTRDGGGTLYTDESKVFYARFVCEADEQSSDHTAGSQPAPEKKKHSGSSEIEACLLIED